MLVDKNLTRAECLIFSLLKEFRRTGILSETEMQRVVMGYVELRAAMPPKTSEDELAKEPFTMMLMIMADGGIADLLKREMKSRKEEAR